MKLCPPSPTQRCLPSLADICHFMLLQGIAKVPSLFWRIFQMLLVQGQTCILLSQYTGPGSKFRFRAPGLVYFEVSYLCTSWAWRLVPCSRQLVSSINCLQVGRMVSIQPLPHIFSIFLVLMLNSQFVCAVICMGLQRRESVLTLFLEVNNEQTSTNNNKQQI